MFFAFSLIVSAADDDKGEYCGFVFFIFLESQISLI